MPDPQRQLRAARRERDQLRAELGEANRRIKALRQMNGEVPTQYADALTLLREIAEGGWRRPDDLGGTIANGGPTSRPPIYSTAAYNKLRDERRWLRKTLEQHAIDIVNDVARWVDGETKKEQANGAW